MTLSLLDGSEEHGRGFRRIIELLIGLVIVPTVVLLVLGILMLVFWQTRFNFVIGILVVTLVACMVTGAVLLLVLLHREAKLSRLQMDFVSKVSHELRTPLTSIRMFAETLSRNLENQNEQTEVCLDVLEKETSRLSKNIERLLDWGRMEAGRRTYERRPDSVLIVATDAVEAAKPLTVGTKHHISLQIEDDLPPILVDRGAMVDALVNLLSNACKYGQDAGEIVLAATADQRTVRISVIDQGIGIPPREHRNIFKKFYTVDERLSREVGGSGLGLAIVRHVAQGHGGRVEVESEPGHGSTFTIVLPRLRAENLELPELAAHGAGC